VPLATSTGPVFNNCPGPTKLRLTGSTAEVRSTKDSQSRQPMGGAGNKLQPGPGQSGPGPGPCAVLGSAPAAASGMFALRCQSSFEDLRGMRSRGESCANAVTASEITIAEVMVRETPTNVKILTIHSDSPLFEIELVSFANWFPVPFGVTEWPRKRCRLSFLNSGIQARVKTGSNFGEVDPGLVLSAL